jgi:hypothetical protein
MMTPTQEPNPTPPASRSGFTWGKALRRFLFWGLLAILGLFLLVQFPPVQNYLVRVVTQRVSTTLGTRVSIDYLRLTWLDQLNLEGVFVEDVYGDTLLYGGSLAANFNLNPAVLFQRGLEIEALRLSDTRFQIRRDVGDAQSNLQIVMARLFPPKEGGEPLNLNLKELSLERVHFSQRDSVRGKILEVYLEEGTARLNELNIPGKLIDIESLYLTGPRVAMTNFTANPLERIGIDSAAIRQIDSLAQAATDSTRLQLLINTLALNGGTYRLDNFRKFPERVTAPDELDFARLDVRDIVLEVDNFTWIGDTARARVPRIQLQESSGFTIEKLATEELLIAPGELALYDLALITPHSQLGDSLHFRFREWTDWQYFPDEVRMDLRFNNSRVQLADIMTFARGLKRNTFFRENRERILQLDGRISGPVNNLRGRDVTIALNDGTFLRGNFNTRNIAVPNEEFISLRLDQFRTRMRTFRDLIPNFNPPQNFDRLGRIYFSGRFDGFLTDFVADGRMLTQIGSAEMDLRLNLKPGMRRANYSGQLQLINFDLGAWSANDNFGLVDFSGRIRNGVGLTAETAEADLSAEIRALTFRDYTYQNATLSGQLNRNFFNGDFVIEDDNIDFRFQGALDFRDSIPVFDFDASVAKIDLLALNLSEADLIASGQLDLNIRNTNLSDLEGSLRVRSLELLKDGNNPYQIDSIIAYSSFDELGRKVFRLESDVATGQVIGAFNINELPGSFQQFMLRNYPGFSRRLKIKPPRRELAENRFDFDLNIVDSKGLNFLLSPQLGRLRDVTLSGFYRGESDSLDLDLEIPDFQYGKIRLEDVVVLLDAQGSDGRLDIAVDSTFVNGKSLLSRVQFSNLIFGDSISFGFTYLADEAAGPSGLDKLNLDGLFFLPDSANYRIRFDESDLVIFEERWTIDPANTITFGKGVIEARDFVLRNGRRRIELTENGPRGLTLHLAEFDFNLIDKVWDYDPLDFSGRFLLDVAVEDVFKMQNLSARGRAEQFLIKGQDWGAFTLDAAAPDLKNSVTASLLIDGGTKKIKAQGSYNLADLRQASNRARLDTELRRGFIDLTVDVEDYPLAFANYWVGNSVSDLTGDFIATMTVQGIAPRLEVDGFINATNGAFTIDYLQTRYRFNEGRVTIDNDLFDATGTVLYDRYGNRARLFGGVSHDRLRDLGLALEMKTFRFLALDLQKGDNPLFYGRALGQGEVSFSGNFIRPDIYVNATVGDSSFIVIPISGEAEASPIDNVRFVDRYATDATEQDRTINPTGVSLEMDLRVLEEARMELVFDEQAGDIIQGQGRGNLRILIPRQGDFQMFGDYNITRGNYLFTLYGVVNKDFSVRDGGRISWSGDPFNANISLEADYQDIRTPPINFVQEYLVGLDDGVRIQAQQPTDVSLTLLLTGELIQPNIDFDIEFPDLVGVLESAAENKRRLLRQEQSELNRQAFGLIVLGQFLPSDLSFNGLDAGTNTLTELISNQFSLMVNNLFSDIFPESGTTFDVNYSRFRSDGLVGQTNVQGNFVEFSVNQPLFNNRARIQVGASYQDGTASLLQANNSAFFGEDLVLEIFLNQRRNLTLRVYRRSTPDIGGIRSENGVGLSWRKEYDSFGDWWRSLLGKGGESEGPPAEDATETSFRVGGG